MASFLATFGMSGVSWRPEDWDNPDYNHKTFKKRSIELCSLSRPHMRAFHMSWFAFFACFIMWFAIPPLMGTIKKPRCLSADDPICVKCLAKPDPLSKNRRAGGSASSFWATDKECMVCFPKESVLGAGCGGLGLTQDQILVSNILSVSGTMIMRILVGPFGDKHGVRRTYAALLVILSAPGFLAATIDSFAALLVIRALISFAGGSFVLTSLWTTTMFDSNVVGTANATTAGWGNLGGGVALEIMGYIYLGFFNSGLTTEKAWRAALAVPPALVFFSGLLVFFFTDDCPLGDIRHQHALKAAERKKEEELAAQAGETLAPQAATSFLASMGIAAKNWRTWIAALCYAFSFGAELTVNGNMPAYFQKGFAQNQHNAGLLAGVFGLVNICARTAGGLMSDVMNSYFGIRGRIWALFLQTLAMALLLLGFTSVTNAQGIGIAMAWLGPWAFLTSMTCGGLFSLVPFIEPNAVGGVSGIVGAGGNLGALFGMAIMKIGYRPGFLAVGFGSLCTAIVVPLLWMPGSGSMLRSYDAPPEDEELAKATNVKVPMGFPQ